METAQFLCLQALLRQWQSAKRPLREGRGTGNIYAVFRFQGRKEISQAIVP